MTQMRQKPDVHVEGQILLQALLVIYLHAIKTRENRKRQKPVELILSLARQIFPIFSPVFKHGLKHF